MTGYIINAADGDTGHVFNETWNPQAIFHDIVMFLLLDWMALVCLWLIWSEYSEPQVGEKIAVLMAIGFWTHLLAMTPFEFG